MAYCLSILSAVLLSLSFQNAYGSVIFPNLGWTAYLALVPLIVVVSKTSSLRAVFKYSFLTAVLYFLSTLYWLYVAMTDYGHLGSAITVVLVIMLCVMQGAFIATAVWTAKIVALRLNKPVALFLPFFWTAIEFFRNYFPCNGFPWANLAMGQADYTLLIQITDLVGIYGLIFMIVVINGWLAHLILHRNGSWKGSLAASIGIGVVVGLWLGYGYYAVDHYLVYEESAPTAKIGMIQPNIPQEEKWTRDLAMANLNTVRTMAEKTYDYVDMVVWPESSYPFIVTMGDPMPGILSKTYEGKRTPFQLIGVLTTPPNGKDLYYNSAAMISDEGNVQEYYHKSHLVPFGEYVPFRKYLSFAKPLTDVVGELAAGTDNIPLLAGSLRVAPLICYEDIFPELSRKLTQGGAGVLISMTNDAWYGRTSAAYQHAALSKFRAVENRRYLLRATNTGVSEVVDAIGRRILVSPMFEPSIIVAKIRVFSVETLYNRYGDWFAGAISGISIALLLFSCYKAPQSRRGKI